jgi:tRNA G18 (ribose-2'-O)-methylase SpoU
VPAPITIDSADDPRIDDYRGLKGREESGEYLIAESELVVRRLLTSDHRPRSFLLSPRRYEGLRAVVDASGAPVYLADPDVMKAIAGYAVHRGVLASADRRPAPGLVAVLTTARRILVLEGSNDTENIGAIARSARALGFDALVLDPTCADPFSRRSVRVSMGEVLHLPVVRCDQWPDAIDTIRDAGFVTWSLTPDPGAANLFEMELPEKLAIVAGPEGPGLPEATRNRTHSEVRIPMHHGVDSLNVGHALAIAMAATSPPVGD